MPVITFRATLNQRAFRAVVIVFIRELDTYRTNLQDACIYEGVNGVNRLATKGVKNY